MSDFPTPATKNRLIENLVLGGVVLLIVLGICALAIYLLPPPPVP